MNNFVDRIVELMEARQRNFQERWGGVAINPVTLEEGWKVPNPYPPGCTEQDIENFENDSGVRLPTDVRQWLKISNGPSGYFGISPTTGALQMRTAFDDFPQWKANLWIPLMYDTFGNYLVKVVEDEETGRGPVCHVESLDSNRLGYAVSSNALMFVVFSLEDEAETLDLWPKDKEYVLNKDPELAEVTVAPCLWNCK